MKNPVLVPVLVRVLMWWNRLQATAPGKCCYNVRQFTFDYSRKFDADSTKQKL